MSLSKITQLPTYVKVIIIIMLTALVGVIAACVVLATKVSESFTPEHAAQVAKQLVTLPDPLPAGWEYGVGMDIGYQKSANVQTKRRGRGHALIQFSQITINGSQSAEAVANKLVMPSVTGMTFEAESKGEETIGGHTAYYVRQHCTVVGKKTAIELALMDIPGGGILQIQSTEDGRDKFDPHLVEPLLQSIKAIGKSASATNK